MHALIKRAIQLRPGTKGSQDQSIPAVTALAAAVLRGAATYLGPQVACEPRWLCSAKTNVSLRIYQLLLFFRPSVACTRSLLCSWSACSADRGVCVAGIVVSVVFLCFRLSLAVRVPLQNTRPNLAQQQCRAPRETQPVNRHGSSAPAGMRKQG